MRNNGAGLMLLLNCNLESVGKGASSDVKAGLIFPMTTGTIE